MRKSDGLCYRSMQNRLKMHHLLLSPETQIISVHASRVIIGVFPTVQRDRWGAGSPCHLLCLSDYSFPAAHSSPSVYFKNSFNLKKKKKILQLAFLLERDL